MRLFRLDQGGLFLALAVVLLAFLPSLGAGFVWDDSRHLSAPGMGDLSQIPSYLHRSMHEGLGADHEAAEGLDLYRPAILTLFSLQVALSGPSGPSALLFHSVSLALHLMVVLFFGYLLRRWITPGPLGLVALLFFGLHPVAGQAVLFASAQTDLLLLLCLLGIALVLDPADPGGRAASRERIRSLRLIGAAALSLIASLSKESAFLLVPLLLALLVRRRGLSGRAILPALATLSLGLALRLSSLDGLDSGLAGGPSNAVRHLPLLLVDALRAMATSMPVGLRHLYYDYSPVPGLVACGSGLLLAGLGVLAWRSRLYAPLAPWCFAMFVAALGPVALVTTVPGWGGFGRFLYVPLPFVLVALAQAATSLQGRAPWRFGRPAALAAGLLLGLQVLSLQGAQSDWSSDEALGASAVRLRPGQGLGYTWVGQALQRDGDCSDALPWYRQSARVDPSYHPGMQNLAICLIQVGHLHQALDVVDALEARHGSGPRSSYARVLALGRLGQLDEAHRLLEDALARAPRDADLLWLRSQLPVLRTAGPD